MKNLHPFFANGCILIFFSLLQSSLCIAFQQDDARTDEIKDIADKAAKAGDNGGMATIYLRVLTEDGKVPNGLKAKINSRYGPKRNRGYSGTRKLDERLVQFEFEVRAGTVGLIVYAKEYAPTFAFSETEIESGEALEKEIVLKKGTTRNILVTDVKGKPIEAVSITNFLQVSKSSSSSSGRPIETNSEGRAELKHLSAEAIQYLIVDKPGYEVERIDNFLEGDSVEIELTPCPLTKGTVVDHLGKPVAGAKVYHAGVSSGYDIIKDRADLKTIAITDQDGNFETNVLSKKNLHTLLVETKNLRSLRGNIAAGKQTKMQMAKPHSINVRFTGDLIAGQEIDFFVRQEIDLGASRTASIDLPPQDSIKTDKQRSFVLRGVLPGSLSIGSLYFSSEIKPDTKEIVIDLDKFTKTMKRTIQLSFADDNETVIPKGVIRIGGRRTEIIDGIAKFEVNSDSQIALSSEGMIGYRIAKEDHGFYIIELAPKLDKVTVGVKPAGVIKGVVTDFKGEPISTTVRCKYSFIDRNISPFPTDIEVLSNKNGQFVFTPIPLGVKAELRTDYIQRSPLKMVTVAKDSPIVTADLRTPETGTATVSVKLESGEPALGAKVKLISASKGSTHTLQKNLQKNGEAILEAVPVEPESGTELSVSIMPRPGFQIPPSQPIKVGDELEFVIQVGHRLTGRVVDTDGNPVKELVVQAHFENKFVSADELTNANGEFLFTRLPDKEVALQARHRWEKLKSEFSKKVTPDSEVPVLLTVKKHE